MRARREVWTIWISGMSVLLLDPFHYLLGICLDGRLLAKDNYKA